MSSANVASSYSVMSHVTMRRKVVAKGKYPILGMSLLRLINDLVDKILIQCRFAFVEYEDESQAAKAISEL